jgi:hypothetical protein
LACVITGDCRAELRIPFQNHCACMKTVLLQHPNQRDGQVTVDSSYRQRHIVSEAHSFKCPSRWKFCCTTSFGRGFPYGILRLMRPVHIPNEHRRDFSRSVEYEIAAGTSICRGCYPYGVRRCMIGILWLSLSCVSKNSAVERTQRSAHMQIVRGCALYIVIYTSEHRCRDMHKAGGRPRVYKADKVCQYQ